MTTIVVIGSLKVKSTGNALGTTCQFAWPKTRTNQYYHSELQMSHCFFLFLFFFFIQKLLTFFLFLQENICS